MGCALLGGCPVLQKLIPALLAAMLLVVVLVGFVLLPQHQHEQFARLEEAQAKRFREEYGSAAEELRKELSQRREEWHRSVARLTEELRAEGRRRQQEGGREGHEGEKGLKEIAAVKSRPEGLTRSPDKPGAGMRPEEIAWDFSTLAPDGFVASQGYDASRNAMHWRVSFESTFEEADLRWIMDPRNWRFQFSDAAKAQLLVLPAARVQLSEGGYQWTFEVTLELPEKTTLAKTRQVTLRPFTAGVDMSTATSR